jgi:hypothetical protein
VLSFVAVRHRGREQIKWRERCMSDGQTEHIRTIDISFRFGCETVSDNETSQSVAVVQESPFIPRITYLDYGLLVLPLVSCRLLCLEMTQTKAK